MRYELNIGLDVAGGDNSKEAREARIALAAAVLPRDAIIEVLGDLAGAEEPCIYASLRWDSYVPLFFNLAEALQQDCIAVAYANGEGALIGPRAAAWGEFNPEYFRRPAVAVAA